LFHWMVVFSSTRVTGVCANTDKAARS
jgi:hypothetical protein